MTRLRRIGPRRVRLVLYRRLLTRVTRGFLGNVIRAAVKDHPYVFGDSARVSLAKGAVITDALLNCSSGRIAIGEYAVFGHGVCLLTGTHDYRQFGLQRQHAIPATGRDIYVGEGVWIGSNVTVLGPCRIGEHAVIAAGAVVIEDVPAYALVGGVPARLLSWIERPPAPGET